mmetsp:Transcript_73718/g.162954  ORF Transcript_73718/g.162954 Transcript_73718/m.162954 type:complete len:279 (+) Transcript_73718:1710-2546(+)
MRLGAGLQDRDDSVLHNPAQSAHLDGITQSGASAVAFGASDLVGCEHGLPHGAADALLLRGPVGGRHARTAPVLIQAGSDHAGGALDRHDRLVAHEEAASALATLEAVCRLVKGEATAHDRKHVRPAQVDVIAWTRNHVAAAHDALVEPAADSYWILALLCVPESGVPNAVCDKRGRASRVAQGLWPPDAQDEGNSTCHHAPGAILVPDVPSVLVAPRLGVHLSATPIVATVPEVNTNVFTRDGILCVASLHHALVSFFEDMFLRRGHGEALSLIDAK